MAYKDWIQESVTAAAEMLAAGMSIREVGAALDVGRNAVLGMAYRARQAGDGRFGPRPRPPRAAPEKAAGGHLTRKAAPKRSAAVGTARAFGRRTAPQPVVVLEPDPGLGLTLWDLGPGQCRHVGVGGYCGMPSGSASYCDHHRAVVYRPSARVSEACLGRLA